MSKRFGTSHADNYAKFSGRVCLRSAPLCFSLNTCGDLVVRDTESSGYLTIPKKMIEDELLPFLRRVYEKNPLPEVPA